MLQFQITKPSEANTLENQILETLNQYISQNPGNQLNEKALEQIHENAKSYDRLVNDLHYLMKTEISPEKACIVQFTTYTFFSAIISETTK